MSSGRVEVASRLETPPAAVWNSVSSFEGVNYELMPLMRMTAPPHVRALDPAEVTLGERICRSWVLLFGVIPFDFDDLVLVELEPGRGFREDSRMLSMRRWQHERRLEPAGEGTLIRDVLTFEPRLPLPGRTFAPIVRATFRHRHRRLRRRFGGGPAQA